jgi:flagellar hook-basal body complex protein FliE
MIQPLVGALNSAIASTSGVGGMSAAGPATTEAASPFGGMLQSMIDQTTALDTKAEQTVGGLLSGQGVDIHDAMIATEKADMAFELALQVRNKAVGAYQQMMAMQF